MRWRLSDFGVGMSSSRWSDEYPPKRGSVGGVFEVVAVCRRHIEVELSDDWREGGEVVGPGQTGV